MKSLIQLLPPKIYEVLERSEIASIKQIIILSIWEIKKLTNLKREDILFLKRVVADYVSPKSMSCDVLLPLEASKSTAVTSGCAGIDKILNNGFRKGSITELFGESGSGKTQVGLQSAAHCWPDYAVYVCTEDLFPVKRFEEIKKGIPGYCEKNDYGKHVFVEHITESQDLLTCIRVRLPKLLSLHKVHLIVIDSIAAPFRVENTNYVQRAEELRELAMLLLDLSQKYHLAVLCINQVTASFESDNEVLPCLGLAWSNMISTRLFLKKTNDTVQNNKNMIPVRQLYVMFAPDLPNSSSNIIITPTGLQELSQ